jgi:hypothetical protein
MAIVTWQQKLDATVGKQPIAKGGGGGVMWEDYNLPDGYWRYTWTNFTLEPHPQFVEVNYMESD